MKNPFLVGCVILLIAEIALVLSLRAQGWNETGDTLKWIASVVAALIPLVIAALLLIKGGYRFSLRAALIIVTLVAIFLYVSVLPILDANRARSGSRRLLATGATLMTEFDRQKFYERLGFDPRDSRIAPTAARRELPPWLMPLAGKAVDIPPDRSIRSISLSSDAQVHELCQSATSFPKLEQISILNGVSSDGLEMLREVLPQFELLTELMLHNIRVPTRFLSSLENFPSLWIWAESPLIPLTLSTEQLTAIAKLPQLKLLFILGYPITDADMPALAESTSFRHVFFRQSAVTQAGKQQLEAALPECEVHW